MKIFLSLFIALSLFADIVIYDGEALVTQTLKLHNSKASLPQCVDPASIFVDARSYRFWPPGSIEDALRPFVGKKVRFFKEKKLLEGKLLSLSPLIIQADRIYWDIPPKDILIDSLPQDFALVPTLVVPGRSEVKVRYICHGVSWQSIYHMELGDLLHIKGLIHIRSSEPFAKVRVKVVAGERRSAPVYLKARALQSSQTIAPKATHGRYLYDIKGRWDLEKMSFLPYIDQDLPYHKIFRVRFLGPFSGPAKIERKVGRYIAFEAPVPLPSGRAYLYGEGILLASTAISDTPKGKPIELYAGEDFDLVAKKVILSSERTKRHTRSKVRYHLSNPKPKAVKVEIVEHIPTTGLRISGDCPYEIVDASTLRIEVNVPSQGRRTCLFQYYLPKK